ncbi:D-alanyl-D-alanine carboxypeptidase [Microbacterium testaceum StLB037]|uniref:D-alanyl-D-alanine carboxypeptidase n=1 Tax=Microbacterium testaceum (strain StLB037) TaxID=979556 RepID=A0A1H0LMI0_MICTS|nr:M15 family metallopeptidase [Microbacterium testaceum]SDO69325.1 D-alanyl-D-alanine carboxypeptidase [Microbacterium testaceum StLB037]
MASPASRIDSPSRRRLAVLAIGAVLAVVLTVVAVVLAMTTAASFTAGMTAHAPFSPTEADGMIPAEAPLTVSDDRHPAMTGLDGDLREALRSAQAAAAPEGVVFDVTSGWRSEEYQRWLLGDAIRTYGSEALAREYVASPEDSSHVTGRAVDIGSLDAQLWIIEHGREWGLCQTYANERWHFEKATDAGGECPEPKPDARG